MIEKHSITMPAARYICRFHGGRKFEVYCRECRNYGCSWSCPPFEYDPLERIAGFTNVRLDMWSIVPPDRNLPLSEAESVLLPYKMELEKEMLDFEHEHHGLACTTVGHCPHCGPEGCARRAGTPCRHPELVRPSLEAFGFDLMATADEIFHIPLVWGHDGMLPHRLALIAGCFY